MATATKSDRRDIGVKEFTFVWEGKDKTGKIVRGEMRCASQAVVNTTLRRQGILPVKVKKQTFKRPARRRSRTPSASACAAMSSEVPFDMMMRWIDSDTGMT